MAFSFFLKIPADMTFSPEICFSDDDNGQEAQPPLDAEDLDTELAQVQRTQSPVSGLLRNVDATLSNFQQHTQDTMTLIKALKAALEKKTQENDRLKQENDLRKKQQVPLEQSLEKAVAHNLLLKKELEETASSLAHTQSELSATRKENQALSEQNQKLTASKEQTRFILGNISPIRKNKRPAATLQQGGKKFFNLANFRQTSSSTTLHDPNESIESIESFGSMEFPHSKDQDSIISPNSSCEDFSSTSLNSSLLFYNGKSHSTKAAPHDEPIIVLSSDEETNPHRNKKQKLEY